MTKRALQQLIHVGCRDLGIDADTRRDLQLRLTGKASMSEMSAPDLKLVADELKKRGFKTTSSRRHKPSKRADVRFVHVLWKALGDAGALRDPTREGLNAFIRKRFENTWGGAAPADIDMLTDPVQIDDIIQALKAWVQREGIDFDWHRARR